jgi:hypothetical protein
MRVHYGLADRRVSETDDCVIGLFGRVVLQNDSNKTENCC